MNSIHIKWFNENLLDTDPDTDPHPDTETWNNGLINRSLITININLLIAEKIQKC